MTIKKYTELYEDTSAISGAGMGSVVSAAPSSLAGATIGSAWSDGGGTEGSGDVSVPYNATGGNRMFQKFPMGKFHGAMTGKKKREKQPKFDFSKNTNKIKPFTKVMSFDDYTVNSINKINRLKN